MTLCVPYAYDHPMVKKSEVSEVMRALVKRRWSKTSKEQRAEAMRKVAQARWAKKRGEKQ